MLSGATLETTSGELQASGFGPARRPDSKGSNGRSPSSLDFASPRCSGQDDARRQHSTVWTLEPRSVKPAPARAIAWGSNNQLAALAARRAARGDRPKYVFSGECPQSGTRQPAVAEGPNGEDSDLAQRGDWPAGQPKLPACPEIVAALTANP